MAFFRRLIGAASQAGTLTIVRMSWLKISGLGFHAVGVFIILSGWTLMQSTARRAEKGKIAWGTVVLGRGSYGFIPMYWIAHLVYLVSPFVARLEPVDDRIILSLLGLRFIDIEMNFMYLNARGGILDADPILSHLSPAFLVGAACWTMVVSVHRMRRGFFARYVLLVLWPQNGLWVLGGFANLSIAGVYARDVACNVVRAITRRVWNGSFFVARDSYPLDPLPCSPAALPRTLPLHLCRFRHRRVLHAGELWESPDSFRCLIRPPNCSDSLGCIRMAFT
jgi:hypothetical protein